MENNSKNEYLQNFYNSTTTNISNEKNSAIKFKTSIHKKLSKSEKIFISEITKNLDFNFNKKFIVPKEFENSFKEIFKIPDYLDILEFSISKSSHITINFISYKRFSEICKDYKIISTGINHNTRNVVIIDYDGKRKNKKSYPDLHFYHDIKNLLIKNNIPFKSILKKENLHFQIIIPIKEIKIKDFFGNILPEYEIYKKVTNSLNFYFSGDQNFTFWRCQSFDYAKKSFNENSEKYLDIFENSNSEISLNELLNFTNKLFNTDILKLDSKKLNSHPTSESFVDDFNEKSNYSSKNETFENSNSLKIEILNNFIQNENLKSSNKSDSEHNIKIISRDNDLFNWFFCKFNRMNLNNEKINNVEYYFEEAYEIYEKICEKHNNFKNKSSKSQIQSIVRSAYKKILKNFKDFSKFNKNDRIVSNLSNFKNKLEKILKIKNLKISKKLNISLNEILKNLKISKSLYYKYKKISKKQILNESIKILNKVKDLSLQEFYVKNLVQDIFNILKNLNIFSKRLKSLKFLKVKNLKKFKKTLKNIKKIKKSEIYLKTLINYIINRLDKIIFENNLNKFYSEIHNNLDLYYEFHKIS